MKLKDLIEARGSKLTELDELKQLIATEGRAVTDEDKAKRSALLDEITALNSEIKIAEQLEKEEARNFKAKTKEPKEPAKPKGSYSLVEALRSAINPKSEVSEATKEVMKRSAEDHAKQTGADIPASAVVVPLDARNYDASTTPGAPTVTGHGGAVVEKELKQVQDPLQDELMLAQLGADVMTGLKGEVSFPFLENGFEADWVSENAEASEKSVSYSTYTMKPHRMSCAIAISKQLVAQDSKGVEAQIQRLFAQAIARKLDKTVFAKHNGTTDAPTHFKGFFPTANGSYTATVLGTPTRANLTNEIAKIRAKNYFGNLEFVTNHTGWGILSSTEDGTHEAGAKGNQIAKMLLDGASTVGHGVKFSNIIPSDLGAGTDEIGVVLGDFTQLKVAQWGNLEIQVIRDDYDLSRRGLYGIVINGYYDIAVNRAEAFATATIK